MICRATTSRQATEFLYDRTLVDVGPCLRMVEAVSDEGRILGVVGFLSWHPNSAEAHFAIDDPHCARPLLRRAAEYLFHEVGVGLAIGVIPADNRLSLRLATGIGFKEVARVRDGSRPGVDLIIHELREKDCRVLRSNNCYKKEAA